VVQGLEDDAVSLDEEQPVTVALGALEELARRLDARVADAR
jgi:hypothetical protein